MGQYEDAETGLYYNRFRYYDAEAGQYVSQDPIGLAGGLGLHGYVHDPLAWVDPLGLSSCNPASSRKGALLAEHLRQSEKYGRAGFRTIQNGRIRYCGEITKASKPGAMAGRRVVREWDPDSGRTRTWMETFDQSSRVRIVRPEAGGPKVHCQFDDTGQFAGTF